MTTDGIFETRGRKEMYGRERFIDVVRNNRRLNATGILDAVLDSVNKFRGSHPQEDDVTLVVVKFT